ncbi:hypothetical protein DdX_22436 [Ditylenchus destructor]|uniref:Uncharacterized protein n=1 Tax=Ditylenchus destructor TaxID=166010 RepID=A0AAD4ME40_9BILA|nr:hypothetical protein DdX_22436 [Ditylenchus destructor]
MLDRLPLRLHLVDDRLEHPIVHQHAILGMVADKGELVLEQARIDGVDDAAHADRAVPGDEMAAVVHRHRRDAIALLDPHAFKGLRQLARVARDPGPVWSASRCRRTSG